MEKCGVRHRDGKASRTATPVKISGMAKQFQIIPFFLFTLFFRATVLDAVPVRPVLQRDAVSAVQAEASSTVTVTSFRFSGNTILSGSELDALLAGYRMKSCTIDELRQAAAIVTKAYHDRGFLLARAFLPVQRIENGVVGISVLEGRVGSIVVEGNRNYSKAFIREYILAGGTEASLSVAQVERALLLLNSRFADLNVSANFQAGAVPGTTDLYVRVEDGFPVHGQLSLNNYGSEYVSRYRFGAEIGWSNALRQGSLLSIGGLVGDRIDRMRVFNAGYTMPLDTRGTMAAIQFMDGSFDVGKDFADLGIHNNETGIDLSLSRPLIRTRTGGLNAQIGFRGSNAHYYLLDEISSKDHTRAVYAGLQGDLVHNGGRSAASLTLTQGLGDLLDGTAQGDPLASRAGAGNDFLRLNASLLRLQPISPVFSALVRVTGQWSGDHLLAGEEWLIGGVNSVHGYAPGEESGDRGYAVNLALRASPLKNRELLQLSAFLDHGHAWKKNSASRSGASLTGAGVGFYSKFDIAVPAEFRFDIGWPLDPGENSLAESPVLYVETAIRF